MQAGGCKSYKEALALAHCIQRIRKENSLYAEAALCRNHKVMQKANKVWNRRQRNIARLEHKAEHLSVPVKSCATGGRFRKHGERGGHDKPKAGTTMRVRRFEGSRLICVYKTHKF